MAKLDFWQFWRDYLAIKSKIVLAEFWIFKTLSKLNMCTFISRRKFPDARSKMKARVSRWISKTPRNDDDESDKHLEARDRRYSCLISPILKRLKSLISVNRTLKNCQNWVFQFRSGILIRFEALYFENRNKNLQSVIQTKNWCPP